MRFNARARRSPVDTVLPPRAISIQTNSHRTAKCYSGAASDHFRVSVSSFFPASELAELTSMPAYHLSSFISTSSRGRSSALELSPFGAWTDRELLSSYRLFPYLPIFLSFSPSAIALVPGRRKVACAFSGRFRERERERERDIPSGR